MNYTHAQHQVYLINYHLMWCPKRRKKVLIGPVKDRLEQILDEVACEQHVTILNLSIMHDYLHLFVSCYPQLAVHQLVRAFKGRSSRLLRREFPQLRRLPSLWTHSYFVSTAGNVSADTIQRYIDAQSTI